MKSGSVGPDLALHLEGHHRPFKLKTNEHTNFIDDSEIGFIYIKEGFVRMCYKRNSNIQTVRIAGPGEIIGFGNWNYPEKYVAVAISPVDGLFIQKEIFNSKILADRTIVKEILEVGIFQTMLRDERICTLQNPTVKGRIAGTLISLANKFSRKDATGRIEILATVDRKILAELSSTVVETLARTLTDLEKKGIIERQGKTIFILNYPALLQISDK